jgi:DNA-binding response OmpR family regulator
MAAKILVVDDELDVRVVLEGVLRLEGYEVETAADGARALELIREKEFDLIVLDLRLPDMSGVEILRIVKSTSQKTQVIMLTGKGTLDSAIEGIRQGVHDYLLKPVRPEQLLESVANALSQIRALEKGPASPVGTFSLAGDIGMDEEKLRQEIFPMREGAVANCNLRVVTWKDQTISLTPNEARLLRIFLERPGKVISPGDLVSRAQGYQVDEKDAPELLRPLLSRLRAKLSPIPGAANWIVNVRGAGYLFERRANPQPVQGEEEE